MPDRGLVIFKVGDKTPALNKQHLTTKEGSLIEVIDEAYWQDAIEYIVSSKQMHTVYAMGFVDPKFIPFLQSTLLQIGDKEDTKEYRSRNKLIELEHLATRTPGLAVSPSTLVDAWRSKNQVPNLWDWTGLKESDFIDASTKSNTPEIQDLNAVSSGSYTVGSGKDYSTWATAVSDIANLTGNLTFTQETDLTATSEGFLTESLNGYDLTFTSDTPHNGDFSSGWVTSLNYSTGTMIWISCEGSGNFYANDLNIQAITTTSSNQVFRTATISSSFNGFIHDIIFDANDLWGNFLTFVDSTPVFKVYNLGILDPTSSGLNAGTSSGSNTVFENITIRGSGYSGFEVAGESVTVRNVAIEDSSYADYRIHRYAYGYNNASEDDTADDDEWNSGSGNITGIDSSDFTSGIEIDDTSTLYGAGANPGISGHTKYINGVDIVLGDVNIGAWGYEEGVGASANFMFGCVV